MKTVIILCMILHTLALTLNGKKKKIKGTDFYSAFNTLKLKTKQQDNIFSKMEKAKSKWMDFIDISFISDDYKSALKSLINNRFEKL